MRVLIVGGGAREHCLAWKARQSPLVEKLYCAPGNAGTRLVAENVPLLVDDLTALAAWAEAARIDLTIVGPEAPLVAGLADVFAERGLALFGPTRAGAQLEGSKVWSKKLMLKYGIPTPSANIFDDARRAKEYVSRLTPPFVVKADGLAAGKGVTVAATVDEGLQAISTMMDERAFGAAGNSVLVEECASGPELSVFALTDGDSLLPLAAACDYKRVGDGDTGPNTGGMGAYSPPRFLTAALWDSVVTRILKPTARALSAEGISYQGVIFAGLMLTRSGPTVLEYNCRFGDPETQVILPRMASDFVSLALATAKGHLAEANVAWDERPCCGAVMAAEGYPGEFPKGRQISGLDSVGDDAVIFHGGTADKGDAVVTSGGRVLTVVAKGDTMAQARQKVYENIGRIRFAGCHYRSDIALREL